MRERDAAGAAGGADPVGSDNRFETLFQKAPFSVQLLARDGRTLRVNQAWEELWQISDGDGIKESVLTEYFWRIAIRWSPRICAATATRPNRRAAPCTTTMPNGLWLRISYG